MSGRPFKSGPHFFKILKGDFSQRLVRALFRVLQSLFPFFPSFRMESQNGTVWMFRRSGYTVSDVVSVKAESVMYRPASLSSN